MSAISERKRLSKRKLLFFSVLVFFVAVLVCEGVLQLTQRGNRLRVMQSRQQSLAEGWRGEDSAREVLHPYFAWTYDPETDPGIDARGHHFAVNEFGFPDDSTSLVKRDPHTINIAIFGGSFAQEFSVTSGQQLISLLQADSGFQNKDINLVRLGMSGMKQPQQMMILNYMLAIGAEFDYAINLDGFNEGVLPAVFNEAAGMHYAHPFGWNARLQDLVDPVTSSISFRLFAIRSRRQQLAKDIRASPLRHSMLRQLIWSFQDASLVREKFSLETELYSERPENERQFAVSGPPRTHHTEEELYQEMVALWMNCSRQMHVVCQGNGITYLHFLQPNQYVPDSKPLSEEEQKIALVDAKGSNTSPWELGYAKAVRKSYPLLRERGQQLIDAGVHFIDLTQIYADEKRIVYRDSCCHANELGYDLIAKAIADEINATVKSGTGAK